MSSLDSEIACPSIGSITTSDKLDQLLDIVSIAQESFKMFNQNKVDKLFEACALTANQNRLSLAQLAIEEAGMGNLEDKVLKNHFSAETVYNAYKNMKTCGIVEDDLSNGYALYAEPVGILAGVIPCTNPTSTTIFKILIALKTRNCIVISPHPRTSHCTIATARILREAAIKAGAPQNCIAWIDAASIELCTELMRHPKIAMIVATGAGSLIKSAYSSGKPCMGGNAGNTPVIIDETADIAMSVNSILLSKTFDNGMICASEQSVIAVDSVVNKVRDEFVRRGAHFLKDDEEKKKLEKIIYKENGALNPEAVGQPADKLLKMAGLEGEGPGARVILASLNDVGIKEGLSKEKLCPCLGFYAAKDYDEALQIALRLVRFGGLGHTSVLYTDLNGVHTKERLRKFEDLMPTGRTLLCMPSSQGAIGGLFNAKQSPSMSLGCGSWGGNSSAEGLQPKHLLNYKQIAERRGSELVFHVPEYVRMGSGVMRGCLVELLDSMPIPPQHIGVLVNNCQHDSSEKSPAVHSAEKIVTLLAQEKGIRLSTYDVADSSSHSWVLLTSTVDNIAKKMSQSGVDAIIAIGGTRTIDASKLIRLELESPGVQWDLLGTRFMSLSQRIAKFPAANSKIKLLACVPTESGSGAEMSPYALVVNNAEGAACGPSKIITVVDWTLCPTMAIEDFDFPLLMSRDTALNAGCSSISNAIESMVSILATDKTRKLSTQAFCGLSKNFIRCVEKSSKDAQEDFHKASAICAMASANAFLGIAESLSHQLAIEFSIPPGYAKFMVLSQVISFNAEDAPSKLAAYPHYERPKAKEQYAQLVRSSDIIQSSEAAPDDEVLHMLLQYLEKLKVSLNIPRSLKDFGIQEKMFFERVDSMALQAFDDQFTGTNPRYPLITELVKILTDAYYGKVSRMRFDDISSSKLDIRK